MENMEKIEEVYGSHMELVLEKNRRYGDSALMIN